MGLGSHWRGDTYVQRIGRSSNLFQLQMFPQSVLGRVETQDGPDSPLNEGPRDWQLLLPDPWTMEFRGDR